MSPKITNLVNKLCENKILLEMMIMNSYKHITIEEYERILFLNDIVFTYLLDII